MPISFGQDMEHQEAAYFGEHFRDLPNVLSEQLGAGFRRLGGGLAIIASNIDMPAFNRVIGLGLGAPITEDSLDEAIQLYQSAGASRFFIPLSKMAERPEVVQLLEAKGFRHYNNWAKLYRQIKFLPKIASDIRIEEVDISQKHVFADIILESFEWPEALRPFLSNPVGHPGWKHYLAYDGGKPVSAAALFVQGKMASMALAGTLPEYRGHGAQSALIARRLRDAAEAGCRWAVSETAEDKPEQPVASYRNMLRLGFELAYLRPNYLWISQQKKQSK